MVAMFAHNRCTTCFYCFALGFSLTAPIMAAGPALVVDRGLPEANLNNSAGDYRSNVRWSLYKSGFVGDDFTMGAAGEKWIIDTIRVWTVPGVNATDAEHLGDFYQDVRLYFGAEDGDLTPMVAGQLRAGADTSGNSNIVISDITAESGTRYDDFGTDMRVWQIDFTHLNLQVDGGAKYRFGAFGQGRAVPNKAGTAYAWFNAASNAEFASAKQDGADGTMLLFTADGRFEHAFNGKGAGWDKSSDIDVQVFGHRADAE